MKDQDTHNLQFKVNYKGLGYGKLEIGMHPVHKGIKWTNKEKSNKATKQSNKNRQEVKLCVKYMFSQQFEQMSDDEVQGQAADRASEFIVTGRPLLCNGEFGFEYNIKILDSVFYRMAKRTPGMLDITIPFCQRSETI